MGEGTINTIGIDLVLNTGGFTAGVERAKASLATLGGSQTANVPVGRGRGAGAGAGVAQAEAGGAAGIPLAVQLGVTKGQVRDLHGDISDHMRSLAASGQAVPVQIKLARINWTAMREEIAAGIGVVPIRVAPSGGGRGASQAVNITSAVIADNTGESMGQARSKVVSSAIRQGVPLKGAGGPVASRQRVIVGDQGPEVFIPNRDGRIVPQHASRGQKWGEIEALDARQLRIERSRVAQYRRRVERQEQEAYAYHGTYSSTMPGIAAAGMHPGSFWTFDPVRASGYGTRIVRTKRPVGGEIDAPGSWIKPDKLEFLAADRRFHRMKARGGRVAATGIDDLVDDALRDIMPNRELRQDYVGPPRPANRLMIKRQTGYPIPMLEAIGLAPGQDIVGPPISPEARKLWAQPNRPFGKRAAAGIWASGMRPSVGHPTTVAGAIRIFNREPRLQFLERDFPRIVGAHGYPIEKTTPNLGGYLGDIEASEHFKASEALGAGGLRELASLAGMQGQRGMEQQESTILGVFGKESLQNLGLGANAFQYLSQFPARNARDLERARRAIVGQGMQGGFSMSRQPEGGLAKLMFTLRHHEIDELGGEEAVRAKLKELGLEIGHPFTRRPGHMEAFERTVGAAPYMHPAGSYRQIGNLGGIRFRMAEAALRRAAPHYCAGGPVHAAGGAVTKVATSVAREQLGMTKEARLALEKEVGERTYDTFSRLIAHGQRHDPKFDYKAKWYQRQLPHLKRVARMVGLDIDQAAAITAEISSNNPWPNNLLDLARLFPDSWRRDPRKKLSGPLSTGKNRDNIWKLLQAGTHGHPASAIATGIKKNPFTRALLGDPTGDPADVWMARLSRVSLPADAEDMGTMGHALGEGLKTLHGPERKGGAGWTQGIRSVEDRQIHAAIARIAKERNIAPREAQAALWEIIRNKSVEMGYAPPQKMRRASGGSVEAEIEGMPKVPMFDAMWIWQQTLQKLQERQQHRADGGPVLGPLQRRIAGLPPLEPEKPPVEMPKPMVPEWLRRAQERKLPPKVFRADGGKAGHGQYIVGELGEELFVPGHMAGIIPDGVLNQIPKRSEGGPVVIGKKRNELFTPPEDGIIVPNHLMGQVIHAARGSRRDRARISDVMGPESGDPAFARMEAADQELRTRQLITLANESPIRARRESGALTQRLLAEEAKRSGGQAAAILGTRQQLSVMAQTPEGHWVAPAGAKAPLPSTAALGGVPGAAPMIGGYATEGWQPTHYTPPTAAPEPVVGGGWREGRPSYTAAFSGAPAGAGEVPEPAAEAAAPKRRRTTTKAAGTTEAGVGDLATKTLKVQVTNWPKASTQAGKALRSMGGGAGWQPEMAEAASTPVAYRPEFEAAIRAHPEGARHMATQDYEAEMGKHREARMARGGGADEFAEQMQVMSAALGKPLVASRNLKGAIAATLQTIVGGGQAEQRKLAEMGIARKKYLVAYDRESTIIGDAEDSENAIATMMRTKELPVSDELITKNEALQKQKQEAVKRIEPEMNAYKAAMAKATPKGGDIMRSLGTIALATTAYGLASEGLAFAMSAVGPAVGRVGDQLLGWAPTMTKVTTALAEQNKALGGNMQATIGAAAAEAGLSGAVMDYTKAALTATVAAKAGGNAEIATVDILRATQGAQGQGGAPQGLYGGYGGVLGTGLFAEQTGGNKGFTEAAAGYQNTLSGGNQIGQGAQGLWDNVNLAKDYLSNPKERAYIDMKAKQQGLRNPGDQFGQILGLGIIGGVLGLGAGLIVASQPPSPEEIAKQKASLPSVGEFYNAGMGDLQKNSRDIGLKDLGDAAARAQKKIGGATKVTYEMASTWEEVDAAVAAATAAGDQYGASMAMQSGIVMKVNGQVAKTTKEYQAAVEQTAKGKTMVTEQAYAAQVAQNMAAQFQAAAAQLQQITIPGMEAQQGLALAAQPYAPAATGILPGGSKGTAAGLAGAGEFKYIPVAKELPGILKAADAAQTDLTNNAAAYRAEMLKTVEANSANVESVNMFKTSMADVTKYGQQVLDLQTQIAGIQVGQQFKQLNNEMRLATRALSDAKGLAGQIGSRTKDNLGWLQREDWMLSRQSQALQMQVTQRQITTNLAVAQFQSSGETPEEAYARRQEKIAEAKIGQKQLGIQKEQYGIAGQAFNVQAGRGVTDAAAAQSLLASSIEAGQRIAGLGKLLDPAEKNLALAVQKAQAIYQTAQGNLGSSISEAAKYVGQFGGVMQDATKAIVSAIQQVPGMEGYGRQMTNANGQRGNAAGGRSMGYYGRFAAGFVGATKGGMNITVGEAASETVAILRNPKSMGIGGWNAGGGGGGGPANISININGPVVRNEQDISALAQAVAREVERSLGSKAQLLGLRGPAY